jgi:hypothetical protein
MIRIARLVLFSLLCISSTSSAQVVRYSKFYGINLIPSDPSGLCPSGRYCLAVDSGDTKLKLHLSGDTTVLVADSTGHTGLAPQYAGTIGTETLGVLTDGANSLTLEQFVPVQAGNSAWTCGYGAFTNPVGTRKNHTYSCGWNLSPGGSQTDPAYGFGGFTFEQYWNAAGSPVQEHYLLWEPPDGLGQQHRYLFFIGAETAPYASNLNLAADQISMSSGRDLNSPTSFSIDSTTTIVNAPSGYPRFQAEDTSGSAGIYSGTIADVSKAQVIATSAGDASITGKQTVRIYSGATGTYLALQADPTSVIMKSPDGLSYVQLSDGVGPYFYANNTPKLFVQNSATYTAQIFRPNVNASASVALGASGGMFGWVGVRLAAGSLPSCDADSAGMMTTVPGGAGVADTVQACLKQAAGDTYAWRTIYTAP